MAKACDKRTRIRAALRSGETARVSNHWRRQFLDSLAESSNVSASAAKAGISPSRAYKVRREEPEFARAWLEALWEGYTHLEMEVVRRLRTGDHGTQDSGRYDFANAVRLLAAHRHTAAEAAAQQRNVSTAEVRAAIDRKIEALRLEVKQEREQAEGGA